MLNYLIIKSQIKIIIYRFRFIRKLLYKYKNNKKLKIFDKANLKKNSIFVDLGGNLGLVSYYIHDKFDCNIFIYEPNPICFDILINNFKNYKKIHIFNKAVSNKNGRSKLYFSKENLDNINYHAANTLEKSKKNIDKKNFKNIDLISIQKVIKQHKYIDLLKIDIEGSEYKILPYITKNINKFTKIYCEFHGRDEKNRFFTKKFRYWLKKINSNKNYKKKIIPWI
jgi:FkbM family methyltransferase